MASPFEGNTPTHGADGSVRRRRDEYRVRAATRKSVEERKVHTRLSERKDVLWQKNPDRILKYRPSHLHYYGWVPLAVLRNLKATVFSEVYLHLQSALLLGWMAAIHFTGLGVPDGDLATLVAMFGTPFLGAIFNYCMVVVFILGLFVTLVVNRWSTVRGAYAKLRGTTIDLCMMVVSTIQNPADVHDRRIQRARTEITRLLNLGHLLIIATADGLNGDFKKSYGVRTAYRSMMQTFKERFKTGATLLMSRASNQSTSPTYTRHLYKPRTLIDYDMMVSEGLMNRDEWDLLEEADKDGMPRYHMVYFWTQSLINKCRAEDWIISAPQMLPLMLNKINVIVESGSSIIESINSQMPYPYVHLVSFVVHMYLIVLSTWFGCFLHTGRVRDVVLAIGDAQKERDDVETSPWMVFWCYLLMTVANVTFQGLLDMHTLLDNPFGNHCAKFPLRVSVSKVTNMTRTMLMMVDKNPAAFEDVFHLPADIDGEESVRESAGVVRSERQQDFADFLNPKPTGQFLVGSVGSGFTDHDRSTRLSSRTKSRTQADGRPVDGPEHRRVLSSDGVPYSHGLSRFANQAQTPTGAQSHIEMGTAPERRLEKPQIARGPSNASGDADIQERFLQGAVQSSMKALKGGHDSQPGTSDQAENV